MLFSSGADGDTITIRLFYYYADVYNTITLNTDGENIYYTLGTTSTRGTGLSVTMPCEVWIRNKDSQENILIVSGALDLKLTKCVDGGTVYIKIENIRG